MTLVRKFGITGEWIRKNGGKLMVKDKVGNFIFIPVYEDEEKK